MSDLLTRSARLLRRAAMGGLACLTVLFAGSIAGSSSSFEGVSEEVVQEASEHVGLLDLLSAGDPPDTSLERTPDVRLLLLRVARAPRPVSTPLSAPRGPRRTQAPARGPPAHV